MVTQKFGWPLTDKLEGNKQKNETLKFDKARAMKAKTVFFLSSQEFVLLNNDKTEKIRKLSFRKKDNKINDAIFI